RADRAPGRGGGDDRRGGPRAGRRGGGMTLTDRLSALSEDKRRLVEMRLRQSREGAAAAPRLVPRERPDGTAPASFAQARVWLVDRMQPGAPTWNIPFSMRLSGALDVAALERALNALRERHAS